MTKPTRSRAPLPTSENTRDKGGVERAPLTPNKVASQPKPVPGRSKGRRRFPTSVRVIAVANQKGGVGKSTTAVSLGAALAELGHRVLVVDLDPQGNASTGLGIRHESREVTVYDVLAAEAPIQGAVVPTPIPGLYAVPSTIDLAGAEIELVSQFSREMRLRKALEPLRNGAIPQEERFGFILLDCPPSLGLLTVNALAAAEELIVPIQCEYYALEGLGQLLRNVRLVQQNVNPGLRLTGIVMTMYDPRTKLSEQVVAEVRKYFGDRVYRTIIPRTVRLSEAPGFGQPITVYDPSSRGAQSYRDLAREVADKLPLDEPMPALEDAPRAIAPPAAPPPMTAPRPLVRDVPPAAEGEVEADVKPEVEGEVEPPVAGPSPRLDSTPGPAGEAGLEVQPASQEEGSGVETAASTWSEERTEPEPQDEGVALGSHTLLGEEPPGEGGDQGPPPATVEGPYDQPLPPAARSETEPEDGGEAPGEGAEGPWDRSEGSLATFEPDPPPKRWWRLFRRGGEG